ncbi:hypothetical protein D3C72_1829180 [compost metagenome]
MNVIKLLFANPTLRKNFSSEWDYVDKLEHKPTKRDITRSELDLKQTMEQHRLNSLEGEINKENYI